MILQLPYPPSINNYYRKYQNRMVISKKGRQYREIVKAIVLADTDIKTFGSDLLAMKMEAYPPDLRIRDLDNIQKSLWDSLQKAGVYKNDSQIKEFHGYMREAMAPDGMIVVQIKRLKE